MRISLWQEPLDSEHHGTGFRFRYDRLIGQVATEIFCDTGKQQVAAFYPGNDGSFCSKSSQVDSLCFSFNSFQP
jgi:hypothetical protein